MNFVELKEEKTKLEGDLAVEIAKLVEAFRQKTGVSVENVSVYMSRVTTYGDSLEQYVVSNVSFKTVNPSLERTDSG